MKLRKDWKAFVVIGLSIFLWIVSLWQLELVVVWLRHGKETFEYPFLLWQTNLWVARDIWYVVNGLSLFIPWLYILTEEDKIENRPEKF